MAASHWCRVSFDGRPHVGQLEDNHIALFDGDLLGNPVANRQTITPDEAIWLPPVEPRQFLGLWNNFHERRQKEGWTVPDFPQFFVKLEASI